MRHAIVFAALIASLVGANSFATENAVATGVANKFAPTNSTVLPTDSILQLTDTFTAQDGRAFTLAERRGRPQLMAMFYSSCKFMCPLLIDSGKGVDHALTPAERARLAVLFVSLDPARDTQPVLSATARKHKLDLSRWTLARTDAIAVSKIAALLNVRYRQLADGDFNHTSALILLDADGRILARTEKMGASPDPDFMRAVKKALL